MDCSKQGGRKLKKHRWKRMFILLLGVNITIVLGIVIFITIVLNSGKDETKLPDSAIMEQNDVLFPVQTNKKDLNRIIDHYLEKEFSSSFDYEVLLTDEVELVGYLPVFNSIVNMKLTFEPNALDNGDLELIQKSISIGQLPLPVPLVLKFVRDSYPLPEWVIIQPNEERVYVSLQNLKLKSNLKVRVDEFDLKKDRIQFSLQLPIND